MAPAEFEVDPEQIYESGTQIRSAAQHAQAQHAAFQAELASYGQPWGNDLIGTLIGTCYLGIRGLANIAHTTNHAAMDHHGARVQAMATNYTQTESANAEAANGIRPAVG